MMFTENEDNVKKYDFKLSSDIFLAASLCTIAGMMLFTKAGPNRGAELLDLAISFGVGSIFASGLTFAGMLRRSKIYGFLTFDKNWDPSLLFVLLSAVLGNIFTFHYLLRIRKVPFLGGKYSFPKDKIDAKLISGAVLFGSGWGLGGLCPGPAINLLPLFTP